MNDPQELIGKHIGQYEIKEHLQRGGTADVYLAYDEGLDRLVALKILLPEFVRDNKSLERFRREARAAANLRHPNIVQVYATGITLEGHNYIAMEYVDGGTLHEKLAELQSKEELLTIPYALAVIRQVADALSLAHQTGIIHRDIKPSNILLRNDGTPVLTDLGIAVIQDSSRLTNTNILIGTPVYMSPEQARGADIDARSDIYSLGVILYELLAGEPVFMSNSPWAILNKHISEEPRPIEKVRQDLSKKTAYIVHACLRKNPPERIQTAQELVNALDEALVAEGSGGYISNSGHWYWYAGLSQLSVGRDTLQFKGFGENQAQSVSLYKLPWLYIGLGALLLALLLYVLWGAIQRAFVTSDSGPTAVVLALATPTNVEQASATAVAPAANQTPISQIPTQLPTETPLPATAAATAKAPATLADSPTETFTPTPDNPFRTVEQGAGLPLGFDNETFGSWSRGDQPNGTFEPSNDQAFRGTAAGKLSYEFASEENDFVVFLQQNKIDGTPNALQMMVYGDGSSHFLNVWITDAEGETWQVPMGTVTQFGWRQMTGYITTEQGWPWTHISGPENGEIDYPITFLGAVLDDLADYYKGRGVVYLDELTAVTLTQLPDLSLTPTSEPTTSETSTPVAGRLIYTAGNQLMTVDPSWESPQELGVVADNSCRSPAVTAEGVSFELYFGFHCGFASVGASVCVAPNGRYEVVVGSVAEDFSLTVRQAGAENGVFIYQGTLDQAEGIRWSPLSSSFLFVAGDEINLAYLDGSRQLVANAGFGPSISPDGRFISYRRPVAPGITDLFVYNIAQGVENNLTNSTSIDKQCLAWRDS